MARKKLTRDQYMKLFVEQWRKEQRAAGNWWWDLDDMAKAWLYWERPSLNQTRERIWRAMGEVDSWVREWCRNTNVQPHTLRDGVVAQSGFVDRDTMPSAKE